MENTHPYSVSYKWTKSDNGINQNSMTFESFSDAWDFYTKRIVDLSEHLSLVSGSLDIQLKRNEDVMRFASITSKSLI
jgi:hypothetical protein